MASEVGVAFVRLRVISTQVASDLKDAIDKGSVAAQPSAEKGGGKLGDSVGKGLNDKLKPAVSKIGDSLVPVFIKSGKTSGKSYTDGFGDVVDNEGTGVLSRIKGLFNKVFGVFQRKDMPDHGKKSGSGFLSALHTSLASGVDNITTKVFGKGGVFEKGLDKIKGF